MKHANKIVLIGNVGSGKSTLSSLLAKRMKAKLVAADELYKVNTFFKRAVLDRKRWSLASDLWFLKERLRLALESEKVRGKSRLVVDSGLAMSWVYANSRLASGSFTNQEWELYQDYYEILTKNLRMPDLVVYLRADVDFLRERIVKRGREFEVKHHSREYLSELGKSIGEYVARVNDDCDVLEIDVEDNEFDVDLLLVKIQEMDG